MLYTFTESADHNDTARQYGGSLEVTAQNSQDVDALIKHFRLFNDSSDVDVLQARITALQSSTLTHVIESTKRPVYAVETCLDGSFMAPYIEWAKRDFGYEGSFPEIDIPRKNDGLCHTHYTESLFIQDNHLCFLAYTSAEPWNGKDAQTYAESIVVDYVAEDHGTRRHEPEFIQKGNGQYYQNPDYLKRHRATPAATSSRLKRAFFDWWVETHANAAQKAVIAGNAEIVAASGSYMGAFDFERPQSGIYYEHTGKDYKSIRFSEFAALGAS